MRRYGYPLQFIVAAAAICLITASPTAAISDSDREQKWEFYIPINYFGTSSWTSNGGTKVDVNGDVGWGFGFGYNLKEQVRLGFEFTWSDTSYNALVVTDLPSIVDVSGILETSTGRFGVQYNILHKALTPFISAGLGWTYVDSNIPTGPAEGGCWWDPWYGQICTTWQPTATDTGFSYGAGVGVRGELTEVFFLQGSYNMAWFDFDNTSSVDFSGWRFEMGWKF